MTAAHVDWLKQAKARNLWRRSSLAKDWWRFDAGVRLADLLGFKKVPSELEAETSSRGWGRLPELTFGAALTLVLIAIAFASARAGWPWADDLFWLGLTLLFLPVALRVAREDVSRQERIGLVVVLGVALYLVKVLQSPTSFIHFDELLHVRTAIDILDKGRLFSGNSLLPVSPVYPGMEIATTAIANLTGLSIFWSGVLLLLVVRAVFISSLFLFLEIVSGSARVAGIASLIYMAHSGFVFFHAMFAYESFAIMFLILVLLSEAFAAQSSKYLASPLCLTLPIFCALVATHHIASSFATILLLILALQQMITANLVKQKLRAVAVAAIALLLFAGWLFAIGNPVGNYLGPEFKSGWSEFYKLITGENSGRKVFVADDGSGLPGWQRLVALATVLLTCLGLAFGFFRTLALKTSIPSDQVERSPLWSLGVGNNARAVLLTTLTLGFPVSILLRLTSAGWEIGNRAGGFLFLGVGLVCAVGIVAFWLPGSKSNLRTWAVVSALTIMFVGGVISGAAPMAVPADYKVSADALSIEPLGIAAASWTKEKLGTGWRFAADRVNRLLLATYGKQRIITGLQDRLDVSGLVLGDELTDEDVNMITSGKVDYLMVDSRLASSLPLVGVYFEKGEDAVIHKAPPSAEALRKFNSLRGVSRTFDNGPIAIYDVRPLHAQK
jgi:hypothetical protein